MNALDSIAKNLSAMAVNADVVKTDTTVKMTVKRDQKYSIVCVYGCFAQSLVPDGVITMDRIRRDLSEYFCEYSEFETSDKQTAVRIFTEEYSQAEIDPNVYDFQEGVDCFGVIYYRLVETDPDGKTTVIYQSVFMS